MSLNHAVTFLVKILFKLELREIAERIFYHACIRQQSKTVRLKSQSYTTDISFLCLHKVAAYSS